MSDFLDTVFGAPIEGAYHLVSAIAGAVQSVFGGAATAVAIVLFTMAVRILLLPLGFAQAKAERKREVLLPRLKELQEKYSDDQERLQRETLAFYRSSGIFVGMLPTLAQIPFFVVMYRLFSMPAVNGQANDLLTEDVLGVPLGSYVFGVGFSVEAVVVFGALLGLITLVGWWTARRQPPGGPGCLRMVHYVTVVIALFVPLAAGIYLLVTTAWTAVQRAILLRDKHGASS
ncbi:YidC/Oxa1 family membrane protein insertase [Allokutzneria sp. A3M-2-11 16]|uniref:YidC/Oxa1 family membrane protein insertase n=1 Tax=Allokutzneria sp. A3M-2-11 16 TaxID=2962043 RepID=UPI0020B64E05|nr:membrane protein insertase YidC [Allokutzneria sp. A3M-2-11 16]MCP3802744.1 YidC/Oxa1 family membrane protein insertase [Allokutzneria sp. A3M-2-11 16]